jgi:hypothetical protein
MKWAQTPKEWKCCECGEKIELGQKYHYLTGVADGRWVTYRTCVPCERIRRDFCCCIGSLRYDLWYELDFDYVTGKERKSRLGAPLEWIG